MKKFVNNENILASLDIGTTKICLIVAEKNSDNNLNIISVNSTPSLGMSKGVVIDINRAVESIKIVLKNAQLESGVKIKSVAVGVSGSHIKSMNTSSVISIKKERVTSQDVANLLNSARSSLDILGHQILHVMPQYFTIDSEHRILDPVGMFGSRLEVKAHVILGSISSVQNIIKCCELSGVSVSDVILEQLASAYAVASEDEKLLGTAILDIGGGTSDFAIYQNKVVKYTKVFSVASNHITNDIALCLRATLKDAERIKCQHGSAIIIENKNQEHKIELAQGNISKNISISDLNSIIEPRVKELFLMLKKDIDSQNLRHFMPTGLILTGGGSLLKDIDICAKNILKMPTRIGFPTIFDSKNLSSPIYSTAYGLLIYMLKESENKINNGISSNFINLILNRMKSWISDLF